VLTRNWTWSSRPWPENNIGVVTLCPRPSECNGLGQNVTTPMLFSGHGLEGQVQVLVNITALGYVKICMTNKQTTYFLFLYNYLWTWLRINGIKLNIYSCITSRSHHALLHVWITVTYLTATIPTYMHAYIFFAGFNSKATKICHLREIICKSLKIVVFAW